MGGWFSDGLLRALDPHCTYWLQPCLVGSQLMQMSLWYGAHIYHNIRKHHLGVTLAEHVIGICMTEAAGRQAGLCCGGKAELYRLLEAPLQGPPCCSSHHLTLQPSPK